MLEEEEEDEEEAARLGDLIVVVVVVVGSGSNVRRRRSRRSEDIFFFFLFRGCIDGRMWMDRWGEGGSLDGVGRVDRICLLLSLLVWWWCFVLLGVGWQLTTFDHVRGGGGKSDEVSQRDNTKRQWQWHVPPPLTQSRLRLGSGHACMPPSVRLTC